MGREKEGEGGRDTREEKDHRKVFRLMSEEKSRDWIHHEI